VSTVTRRVAASPDQITAADARFQRLVREVLQRYLAARGAGRGGDLHSDPDAQLLWQQLVALYPEFQRKYCELFVELLGPAEAGPVLRELLREPLQRYLRARAAITPDLTANIQRLSRRWCNGV
jgi:hypothetical protein